MCWEHIIAVYGYVLPILTPEPPTEDEEAYDCFQDMGPEDFIDKDYPELKPYLEAKIENVNFYRARYGDIQNAKIHRFTCCSESNKKYIVVGLAYDEIERNLFLDSKFDTIARQVFNYPTAIETIDDILFQHDARDYTESDNQPNYKTHKTKQRSAPGVRKQELLTAENSIKKYVDELSAKYPCLKNPVCLLMMDDCISCT